jgi:ornithine--oxo-acid transaminase
MRKTDHDRPVEARPFQLEAESGPAWTAPAGRRVPHAPSAERALRGHVQLIGAASGLGLPGEFCAEGPARLKATLASSRALRGRVAWHAMLSAGVSMSGSGFPPRGLGPFSRRLAAAVRHCVAADGRFVVLGGDHSCAIGTWNGARAGLRRRGPLGLIWIDAHMDAHTALTSPSGRAHGMPLATLLGAGDPALNFFGDKVCVSPERTFLIGVRSFEHEEEALLRRLGVRVVGMAEVRKRGLMAVMREALLVAGTDVAGFGLSIDLDAIDPADSPAVSTPEPDGIPSAQLLVALPMACRSPRLLGVEVAEFNPTRDEDGRTAHLVERIVDVIAQPRATAGKAVKTRGDAAEEAGASGAEALRLEEHYLAHNYAPLPVLLVRGKGVHVWDERGRAYLDMMSAYSAVSLGHAHPRLLRVLSGQAARLAMVSRAYHSEHLGLLAKRLCELTGMERMLPMNSGAEAVETALKAARKWAYRVKGVPEDRAEIICCAGNFHGRTSTVVGMSSEAQYRDGFGPFAPGFKIIPYGNAAALASAISERTAAFLVEPVQGEAGIIVPPAGYLAECAALCRSRDVLLICDEVQTGLGRTGRLLASEHEGVVPDGLILGKALGGGLLPVSAFLSRADVMGVFQPGDHGSTFGGNPLACAVALEALRVIEGEGLVEKSAALGERLLAGLGALASPLVREVRGLGLFAGVELITSRVSSRRACEIMLKHGILTKDTHATVLRFAPPLVIRRGQLDDALARIGEALQEIRRLA